VWRISGKKTIIVDWYLDYMVVEKAILQGQALDSGYCCIKALPQIAEAA
jgi:hypothetical protein